MGSNKLAGSLRNVTCTASSYWDVATLAGAWVATSKQADYGK